jgi:hypothetical protein
MAGKPNAFLKLPYELRRTVYQHLLSTHRTKRTTDSQGMGYYDLQPAILQTCQLINDEARPVLYHDNSFVRIITDESKLQASLTRFGVPTFSVRHTSQVYSLGMSISTPQRASGNPYYFIIASEDLPTLCDLLWLPTVRAARSAVHFYLCASFSAPPHAISLRKILLASFKSLWIADKLSIYGTFDDNLPSELQASVLDLADMPPTDAVEFVHSLEQKGLQYLGESEHVRAGVAYNKAFRAAWIFRYSHCRDSPAYMGDPSDQSRLWCRLLVFTFQVAAGLAVAYVGMKEWRPALWACTEALRIPHMIYWWPDMVFKDDAVNAVIEVRRWLELKLGSSGSCD